MEGDSQNTKYKVILFYKFVDLADPEKVRDEQRELCASLGLKGRMLLAGEGINATFEGTVENVNEYMRVMNGACPDDLSGRGKWSELFGGITFKESEGTGNAFTRLQVTVKKEVVTLGAGRFDVERETAPAITADELEKMYEDGEDFVVLDLRNDYEINVGAFEKTIHPDLQNFRELPEKLKNIEYLKNTDTKIIPVCTGGIRCDKATCLLQKEGFKNLYQLKDGIHTYMAKYPGSHFKGSLFVFDNRMVTPVVDTPEREVIGKCAYCGTASEEFYSNDTVRPSRKVIACDSCAEEHSSELRRCVPVVAQST